MLAIAIGAIVALPAAASAAPVNRASDRAALNAYHGYLQGLLSIVPSWRQHDNSYIASISGQCGGVLTPLQHAAPGTFNKNDVLAFGIEAGGDLDAVVYPAARPALGRLAASVGSLQWSSAGIRNVVNGYVSAERRLFAIAPSNLCADAHALEASHGQRISHGTGAFVSKFAHRVAAADRAGTAFLNVLQRYAAPSDRGLLSSINRLLHQFVAKVDAQVKPEATKLVGTLGL